MIILQYLETTDNFSTTVAAAVYNVSAFFLNISPFKGADKGHISSTVINNFQHYYHYYCFLPIQFMPLKPSSYSFIYTN